jgi:hypothetical protein
MESIRLFPIPQSLKISAMKFLLRIMVFTLLLSGCANPKAEFIRKLTNNNSKYWNLVSVVRANGEKIDIKKNTITKITKKFTLNREFLEFHYNGKNMYNEHQYSDVIVPNRWEYIDQQTIRLNGGKVRLKYLSEDTLIYYESGDMLVFARSLYNLDSLVQDMPMSNVVMY